eukprot:scaffold721_cov131-Cylindrotheca_fusiformis.AAC.8
MVSDQTKIALLAICTIACLGTFFTSSSIAMGNAGMRILSPQTRQHCAAPNRAASECQKEGKSCASQAAVATKCKEAVKRAYRHINLGGCPSEIKALSLCEEEWCHSVGLPSDSSCVQECSKVREGLNSCVERQTQVYFKKYGLRKNGTAL